ncbi:MAG TPA: lysine transporter LysE, partial [Sulfitobacter sp.]|nr:lysine transporter LysE [Sulfitobacter sp.]
MSISLADLLLYCGALLILFLTPGPVWLAMMARALSGGFQAAWPLALGVAIGDMLWPLVAVLGITWILSVFDTVMEVLRWIASGVFILMGVALIRQAGEKISSDSRLTL